MALGNHAVTFDRIAATRWRIYCSCGWVGTATGATVGAAAAAAHNAHLTTVGAGTRAYA